MNSEVDDMVIIVTVMTVFRTATTYVSSFIHEIILSSIISNTIYDDDVAHILHCGKCFFLIFSIIIHGCSNVGFAERRLFNCS